MAEMIPPQNHRPRQHPIMETTETEVDRITRAAPVSRPRHLLETAIPPVEAAPFGGTSSGSSSTAGTQSGSSTVTSAKTGDNTNVLRPLIIAVIALIVLIGGYVWSRKKKK